MLAALKFFYWKNKKYIFAIALSGFLLSAPMYVAYANPFEWLGKWIIGGLIWLIFMIPILIFQGLTQLSIGILSMVTDPAFVTKRYINISFINEGWRLSLNLATIFLVIALIGIGIGTALRLTKPKDALIKFLLAAVMMYFSHIIAGIFIDFSNIFANTFFAAGPVNGIVGWGNLFSASCDAFTAMFSPGISFIDSIMGLVSSLLFLAIFGFFIAYTVFKFAALFFARIIAFWILIIVGPFAFAGQAFSTLKGGPALKLWSIMEDFYKTWWDELIGWTFTGIFGAMFLYFAGMVANSLLFAEKDLFYAAGLGKIVSVTASQLLPFIIPIIIMNMGVKYSLKWGSETAKGISDMAGNVYKGGLALAGGAALAGGRKLLGSKGIQGALGKAQEFGAKQAAGSKTKLGQWLGHTINRSATSLRTVGLEEQDRTKAKKEGMAEARFARTAKAGKGAALADAVPVTKEEKKAWGKALVENYQKGFLEKGKDLTEKDQRKYVEGALAMEDDGAKELAKLSKINPLLAQGKINANDAVNDKLKVRVAQGVAADDFKNTSQPYMEELLKAIKSSTPNAKTGDALGKSLSKFNPFSAENLTKDAKDLDKELDKMGLTASQKRAVTSAMKNFVGQAGDIAVKATEKSLSPDAIAKMDRQSFMSPETIQNIANSRNNNTIFAAMARGGGNYSTDLLNALQKDPKRYKEVADAISLNTIQDSSEDLLNTPAFVNLLRSSKNNGAILASMEKMGSPYATTLLSGMTDPKRRSELAQSINPDNITKMSDMLINNDEMQRIIMESRSNVVAQAMNKQGATWTKQFMTNMSQDQMKNFYNGLDQNTVRDLDNEIIQMQGFQENMIYMSQEQAHKAATKRLGDEFISRADSIISTQAGRDGLAEINPAAFKIYSTPEAIYGMHELKPTPTSAPLDTPKAINKYVKTLRTEAAQRAQNAARQQRQQPPNNPTP